MMNIIIILLLFQILLSCKIEEITIVHKSSPIHDAHNKVYNIEEIRKIFNKNVLNSFENHLETKFSCIGIKILILKMEELKMKEFLEHQVFENFKNKEVYYFI
jgi:hypothetical protein